MLLVSLGMFLAVERWDLNPKKVPLIPDVSMSITGWDFLVVGITKTSKQCCTPLSPMIANLLHNIYRLSICNFIFAMSIDWSLSKPLKHFQPACKYLRCAPVNNVMLNILGDCLIYGSVCGIAGWGGGLYKDVKEVRVKRDILSKNLWAMWVWLIMLTYTDCTFSPFTLVSSLPQSPCWFPL